MFVLEVRLRLLKLAALDDSRHPAVGSFFPLYCMFWAPSCSALHNSPLHSACTTNGLCTTSVGQSRYDFNSQTRRR